MAAIHLAADSFHTAHPRYHLDLSSLPDRWTEQFDLEGLRTSKAEFVQGRIEEIRQRFTAFDPGPTGWGIIHGDVQGLNFHFDRNNQITFLDFDLCGYGWRAYDIAYYYTCIPAHLRGPLIRGYESIRPLTAAEHGMLPTFGRLAWIREGDQPEDLLRHMRNPYLSYA